MLNHNIWSGVWFVNLLILDVEISFALTSVTVSEEVGVVSITLLLSGLHSIPVSVSLSTQPLTATGTVIRYIPDWPDFVVQNGPCPHKTVL